MATVVPLKGRGKRPRRGAALLTLLDSWELALLAADRKPGTVRSYLDSAQALAIFLETSGHTGDVETVTPEHIRSFLLSEIERTSAGNAAKHYRNISVLFSWLEKEGERLADNPMKKVDKVKVGKKVKTFLAEDEQRAILAVCDHVGFENRRDMAILRVFMDTGIRVSSMTGIRVSDVDRKNKVITITLKGGDQHLVPLGRKAIAAVDKYIRERARHSRADSPWLWLGVRGHTIDHMTRSGIYAMVKRRGEQAGIKGVHPHQLRRTFTHEYLRGGGSPDQVAAIAGWRSTAMVQEYAGDLAAERAREAHARLSPGDRI